MKRRLKYIGLLLIAFLAVVQNLISAITHVQTVNVTGTGVLSVTTASITTTTGDLIVLGVGVDRIDSAPTASDNKSNSWSQNPSSPLTFSSSFLTLQHYSVLTTGGSGHTFTYTSSQFSQGNGMFASEFSGTASPTSSVFDQNAAANQAFTSTPSTGATGTRTQANEVLVGHDLLADESLSSVTPGTNFTIPTNGSILSSTSFPNGSIEYWIVSATGTDAATWTLPSTLDSGAIIGTYKAAGAGAAAAGFNKRRKLTQLGLP